jgi:hypothetical protein
LLVAPDGSRIIHMSPVFLKNGEADGIWCLNAPFDGAPVVTPQPGGDGVLVQGEGGWFAVSNAPWKPGQIDILALRFDDLCTVRAKTSWPSGETTGDASAWRHLPRYWMASVAPGSSCAMRLDENGGLRPVLLDWPVGDEGQESPMLLRRDPSNGDIVVGKYSSNEVLFCDADTGVPKQGVMLEGNARSVRDIQLDQPSQTMWVLGYDMLFRFAQKTRKLERSAQVQPPTPYESGVREKVRSWVGDFVVQPEQKRVCIARPFAGDVVAVDWETLAPVAVAKTGGEPAYLAAFGDLIVARDWRTGETLRATLS